MKRFHSIRLATSFLAIVAGSKLETRAEEQAEALPSPVVELEEGDCGNRCSIVFGRVGERLHCDLDGALENAASSCEVGEDAQGRASSLPIGLVFDAERAVLTGVPLRSGFFEFVVLRSEGGVTREQVVLIDIQGLAHAGAGVDYASYFANGIR